MSVNLRRGLRGLRSLATKRDAEVSEAELDAVAALLAPGVPSRECRRAETKERMLREARRTRPEGRDDAGSLDTPTPSVHKAQVLIPDGVLRIADVEEVSEERAAQIAQTIALTELQSEDR